MVQFHCKLRNICIIRHVDLSRCYSFSLQLYFCLGVLAVIVNAAAAFVYLHRRLLMNIMRHVKMFTFSKS